MTVKERVLSVLDELRQPVCETCLTTLARVTTRQTTYMACRELAARGITDQQPGLCRQCHRPVHCNRLISLAGFVLNRPHREAPIRPRIAVGAGIQTVSAPDAEERPWFWEGNVQAATAAWLEAQVWSILQAANTASRERGVDLILQKAPDKELWVTVKGFPQKSQYVQAHHWFAGAIFDLVAYRNAHARLYLAMALPDGYATYAGLAEKAAWLRRTMPFTLIWVSESGSVRSE